MGQNLMSVKSFTAGVSGEQREGHQDLERLHHVGEKHPSHPGRVSGSGNFRKTGRGDDNDVDRNDRIVFEETGQASKPDFVEPVRAQPRLRRHQAHRLAKPASLVSHHFWGSGREATFLGEVL